MAGVDVPEDLSGGFGGAEGVEVGAGGAALRGAPEGGPTGGGGVRDGADDDGVPVGGGRGAATPISVAPFPPPCGGGPLGFVVEGGGGTAEPPRPDFFARPSNTSRSLPPLSSAMVWRSSNLGALPE